MRAAALWIAGPALSPTFAMQTRGTGSGLTMVRELTIDKVDKFLRTRADLAALERQQPQSGSGFLVGVNGDEVVATLESDDRVRLILAKIGWSARDYWDTWSDIGKTLIATARLDSGQSKEIPVGVSEANIRFLRNLPDDLSPRFLKWKRAEIDPLFK
jgi:hypothetical protein